MLVWGPLLAGGAESSATAGAVTADLSATIGAFTLSADATVTANVTAPGPTITALQTGSGSWKWVGALEGYEYLFTDATSAQAVTAWSGRDWSQALIGCSFDCTNEQKLNPWEPFTPGGSLTFYVPPQSPSSDPFGVSVFRNRDLGDETILNAALDRDDTTATVLSTTGFASSGTIYCGTEAIAYSGTTATTFTGLTRGKYAPFTVDGGSTSRFGQDHRTTTDPNSIKILPLVSERPRSWLGKWFGLWLHRYDHANGLLNTRADARLVYPGRVVEIADDPATMTTVVTCEHVLDYIKRAYIGRDMWSAKVAEGVTLITTTLRPDMRFTIGDYNGTTTRNANDLTVVAGTPASVNEIQAGVYTLPLLCSKINDWLASEKAASRLHGTYWINIESHPESGIRTWFGIVIPGSGTCSVGFLFPKDVNKIFGELTPDSGSLGRSHIGRLYTGVSSSVTDSVMSEKQPLRNVLLSWSQLNVYDEQGTRVDQSDSLPQYAQWFGNTNNGVFLVAGKHLVSGRYSGGVIDQLGALGPPEGAGLAGLVDVTYDPENDEAITIKQVLLVEDSWQNVILKLFYSTGTAGYNHATYDAYPAALSLGIPGELLGDNFENSVANMPGADSVFTLRITEPTKLSELLTGSLVFRWAFLRWKDEGLQFYTWATPLTGSALTEANKAAPVGQDEIHKSPTVLTSEWQRQIIKIDYDRNVRASDNASEYRSSLTLVDRTAVDDAGGDVQATTIKLADVYNKNGIDALADYFKGIATTFTRPISKIVRSIDSRFFEGYAVGDTLLVTDEFARDPDTGLRGVAARPGIIITHRWSLGGAGQNGAVADMLGEVEIMFRDLLRVAPYVPTATVDDTSTNSGYVVGTKVLTLYAHKHSKSSESADASHFTSGMKVKLVQIDPSDPAAAATHDDTVASQTGNTVTLTTGYAGFDNAKRYKLVFDGYSDSIAAQQASYAYQADDADGMIADTRAPFQYVAYGESVWPPSIATSDTAGEDIELPANDLYGDGVGFDVGTAGSVNRLVNNLFDYKTAHSFPRLHLTELSGASSTGTYYLVDYFPINLGWERLHTVVNRKLIVSPIMKSSDGGSATVRVTLCRNRPQGTDLDDVGFGALYAQATFTTTSTTYAVQTAQELTIGNIPDSFGTAYVLVECTLKARTYGLAVCQEGEREYKGV